MWLYHVEDCFDDFFHINHFYVAPWPIINHENFQNLAFYNENIYNLTCFHPYVCLGYTTYMYA